MIESVEALRAPRIAVAMFGKAILNPPKNGLRHPLNILGSLCIGNKGSKRERERARDACQNTLYDL